MSFIDNIISSLCSTALEVAKFLFKKVISEITTLSDPAQLFDSIFPGAATLDEAIYTIAIALGILFAMTSLFLTMTTSDSKAAESPLSVVLRMFIFLPLTIWARQLCKLFYSIQSVFLQTLAAADKAADASGFMDVMVSGFASSLVGTADSTASALPPGVNTGALGAGGGAVADAGPALGVLSLLVGLIFVLLLFIDMLKLMMSIIEQYVLIGILAHLAPMAIATGCSKRTSQIFTSWLNLFVSHLLIFILNQWSLSVFTSACATLSTDGWGKFGTSYGLVTWVVALDAFLRLSQHWEQILNKLGLKAVGTGNGFMGSLIAAAAIARSMGRHIGNAAKDGIKMAQGTWQPRPGSLAEALTSGARARSEATPGKAAGKAGVGYGKTQDKRFNEGFAAAQKDIAAGKPMSPLPIPTMDKSRQWQVGYKSAYAAATAAGGVAAGAGAMAQATAKNAANNTGAVKAMRNDAMHGMKATSTRPSTSGNAHTYPRDTTRIDPASGKAMRVASDCSSDARSLATAARLTNAVGSGTTLRSSVNAYGAPESLSIKSASYASYDSKNKSGSMSFSGDVLDSNGTPVATFEHGRLSFMPDTPQNRAEVASGNYAAFEVDIGSGGESEKYIAFASGSACVTDGNGNVLLDQDGQDILFGVSYPMSEGEKAAADSATTSAPESKVAEAEASGISEAEEEALAAAIFAESEDRDSYNENNDDDSERPISDPDEPRPNADKWRDHVDDFEDDGNGQKFDF